MSYKNLFCAEKAVLVSIKKESCVHHLLLCLWVYLVMIDDGLYFQNNSNKAVKKLKVSVRQFADICLFSTAQYKCTVDEKVS